MRLLKKYLESIQSELYANPLQTRPKPTGGITKNKDSEKKKLPIGVHGPAGIEVDLEDD